MKLFNIFGHGKPAGDTIPEFIREIEDIRGVRVLRLQGPVGKEIGDQVKAAEAYADHSGGMFERPLLIDFKDTTSSDLATVAFLVQTMRRRMATHLPVGIINAPPTLLAEFQIAKLDSVLKVYASEEQALAALSAGSAGSAIGGGAKAP